MALADDVFDYIHECTDNVIRHHKKLPDVSFEADDGKLVAVEAAEGDKEKAEEKIGSKIHILKKYDEYYIVVEDGALKTRLADKYDNVVDFSELKEKMGAYLKAPKKTLEETFGKTPACAVFAPNAKTANIVIQSKAKYLKSDFP